MASKVPVDVEVCLHGHSTLQPRAAREMVAKAFAKSTAAFVPGHFTVGADDAALAANVASVRICELPEDVVPLPFWRATLSITVYQLCTDGPSAEVPDDEDGGGGGGDAGAIANYTQWELPNVGFEGMWESLVYDAPIKEGLLQYAHSGLLFSDAGVDANLISWNRVIMLHGPPGTGKTSLCKALAQKLAIRLGDRFASAQLIEISAHSLFSKWFSESGKLVARLFAHINEMLEDGDSLIVLLIDEVESLTSARKAAVSGSEPSDAVRVVNAVLTAIDALRGKPNVLLLTTSNISGAIDVAFVDRADVKAFVGPPSHKARYEILGSCLGELMRVGLVAPGVDLLRFREAGAVHATLAAAAGASPEASAPPLRPSLLALRPSPDELMGATGLGTDAVGPAYVSALLWEAAAGCDGFSGRALRKLPLQAHAAHLRALLADVGGSGGSGGAASASASGGSSAAAAASGGSHASVFEFAGAEACAGGGSGAGASASRGGVGGGRSLAATPPDVYVRALAAAVAAEQAARAGFASG